MSKAKWTWPVVGAMSCAWAGTVIWMETRKLLNFGAGWDIGLFVQAIWSTAHGRPFYISLQGGPASLLAQHFTPILAALVPLYWIWPDPRLLEIAQAAALALAVIPLFLFARRRIGPQAATLAVLAYLLFPALHAVALEDFHEISFAVPLLMAAGAALLDKRLRLSLAWLLPALLVKEEVAFIAIGFGLYAWLVLRRRRFGIALAVAAALWAVLVFRVFIPAFNGGSGFEFFDRYATLGQTPAAMVRTLVLHPLTVARLLTTPSKLLFVFQLLLPLAGLPLLGAPAVLLALPTLAYLMLSDFPNMTSITGYYSAPLIPFLLLAAVVGLERVRGWGPKAYRGALAGLAAAALLGAALWSQMPGGRAYSPDLYRVTPADRAAVLALQSIPPDASLADDGTHVAWVANRFRMASIRAPGAREIWPDAETQYLTERTLTLASPPLYPWVVANQPGAPVRVPRYALVQQTEEGLAIWKWRGQDQDVILPRYDTGFEQGLTLVAAGTPPEGPAWGPTIKAVAPGTVPIWMAWGSAVPLDHRITFTLHLIDDQGRMVGQIDSEMDHGYFPTTLWHIFAAQYITMADAFPLQLSKDVQPGRYHLMAGAYNSDTVSPLSRLDGRGQWVELTTIDVVR